MTRKIGDMDLDLFEGIVKQLKGYSPEVWLSHFGEPLLTRDLDKYIKTANKYTNVVISTNALALNEEKAQMLLLIK